MLTKLIGEQIYQAIHKRPHTIQELAGLLDKSWLTVDKYVERLIDEGLISVHTFRGGTRGALKIVYWNQLPVSQTGIQKRLFEQVVSGRTKYDFAPSDLAHYAKQKSAWYLPDGGLFSIENFRNLKSRLLAATDEVLIFSGNLSFCAISDSNETIFDVLRTLLLRGVHIKIICRIEIVDVVQIRAALSLEQFETQSGKLSIRHAYHPLRAIIIDNSELSLKETKNPKDYFAHELQQKMNIIYVIEDAEWIEWARNLFFTLYRTSIDAHDRLREMDNIQIGFKVPKHIVQNKQQIRKVASIKTHRKL
jgi:hypothetical protein